MVNDMPFTSRARLDRAIARCYDRQVDVENTATPFGGLSTVLAPHQPRPEARPGESHRRNYNQFDRQGS